MTNDPTIEQLLDEEEAIERRGHPQVGSRCEALFRLALDAQEIPSASLEVAVGPLPANHGRLPQSVVDMSVDDLRWIMRRGMEHKESADETIRAYIENSPPSRRPSTR